MKPKYKVFISYSRKDEELIAPLIALLRLSGKKVFRDVDEIKPGQEWAKEIEEALEQSEIFILFWCCHSAQSVWVAREISLALKDSRKKFIPALLCRAPVPSIVSTYQWIDFRDVAKHSCAEGDSHKATTPEEKYGSGGGHPAGLFDTSLTMSSQPLKVPPPYRVEYWSNATSSASEQPHYLRVWLSYLDLIAFWLGLFAFCLSLLALLLVLLEVLLSPWEGKIEGALVAVVVTLLTAALMELSLSWNRDSREVRAAISLLRNPTTESSRWVATAISQLIEEGYSSQTHSDSSPNQGKD